MTERERKKWHVYFQVMNLEQPDRDNLIDLMGIDPDLARDVKLLFEQPDAVPQWFLDPAVLPKRIGDFEIKRRVGQGGQGEVFEAVQSVTNRLVALKVLQLAAMDSERFARFQSEAKNLGLVDVHPNVVTVFEAGVAKVEWESGASSYCPFIAMEYINGTELDEFVRQERAATRRKCELFVQVCAGAHRLHLIGIVHRDLKPANILVTSAGTPKLVDFGFAVVNDLTTWQRDRGRLIGTRAFMSPEQCNGSPNGLDYRSDVYTLGVILHLMLSAAFPYDHDMLEQDFQRTICNAPPVLNLDSVEWRWRAGLRAVLLKALTKDQSKRYIDANSLANAVEAVLANRPVDGDSRGRRIWLWACRNPILAVLLPLVFFALLAAVLAQWDKLRVAEHAQIQNDAFRSTTARLVDAIKSRTAVVSPSNPDWQTGLSERPGIPFSLMLGLPTNIDLTKLGVSARYAASAYAVYDRAQLLEELDFPAESELAYREVLAILTERVGSNRRAIGMVEARVGEALRRQQKLDEAEKMLAQALERTAHEPTGRGPECGGMLNGKAAIAYQRGKYPEADRLLREAMALVELGGVEYDEVRSAILHNRGVVLRELHRLEESEDLFRESSRINERIGGVDSGPYLDDVNAIAVIAFDRGDFNAAESLLNQVIAGRERLFGMRGAPVADALQNRGQTRRCMNKFAEAEIDLQRALSIREDALGDDHWLIADSLSALAALRHAQATGPDAAERLKESETLHRQALEIRERLLSATHPLTLLSLRNLGELQYERAQYEEAASLLRQYLSARQNESGVEDWVIAHTRSVLGRVFVKQKRFAEAEPILLGAQTEFEQNGVAPLSFREKSLRRIIELYKLWDEAEESERHADQLNRWRKQLDALLATQAAP